MRIIRVNDVVHHMLSLCVLFCCTFLRCILSCCIHSHGVLSLSLHLRWGLSLYVLLLGVLSLCVLSLGVLSLFGLSLCRPLHRALLNCILASCLHRPGETAAILVTAFSAVAVRVYPPYSTLRAFLLRTCSFSAFSGFTWHSCALLAAALPFRDLCLHLLFSSS